ncbi:MAG: tyrosine-type recombinase/integrase [Blastocatellia bacterium]
MPINHSLTIVRIADSAALRNAIALWADATTDASSSRRADLLRDKQRAIADFFAFAEKHPAEVRPSDVKAWQAVLEAAGLKPATVYWKISRLSSFYTWAMAAPELQEVIRDNPVRLARPKAPKAYQTKSAKSLEDDQLQTLIETVRARAGSDDIVGKRDYALLLFYVLTGMRRQEIISLRGTDIRLKPDSMVILAKIKGGDYVGRELREPRARQALMDYLEACGRAYALKTDSPIWTRHDRAGKPGEQLTSHAFVKNLQKYAKQAGIDHINLHQTRHTFARMVAEDTGSLTETMDALGHKNISTTRVYVQRIAIRKDKHSERITARLQNVRT